MLLYLLAATIVQPAVDEPPAALKLSSPPHNYLNLPLVTCGKGNSDEVVVCGSSDADKRYRLHPIDERKYAEAPIRAKTNIGPDTLDVGGKQTTVGGFPSNRVMITFTVPF